MTDNLLALKHDWLDAARNNNCTPMPLTTGGESLTTGDVAGLTSNCCPPYQGYTYYYPWTYPVYVSSPARPIKLTLSEVDRLRKAAKTDDKLKAILSKFTDQIEITVDFD